MVGPSATKPDREASRSGAPWWPTPSSALARAAAEFGSRDALVFPLNGGRLSFSDLDDRATWLARALTDIGVTPGTHVAILAENRIEWPVVQMAIARAGAVLVPLNTHYRLEDLEYALRQSRTELLFLSERFRSNHYLEMARSLLPRLPLLREIVALDEGVPDLRSFSALLEAGRSSTTPLPEVGSDSIASLQYTSGTTGFPKGALLTHAGMMRNAWEISGRLGLKEGDRWTSIIPLFHCAGCIMCILGCLQRGAAYVGVPAFDPEMMFRVIESERCTLLSGVPTSHLAMLQHPARSHYDISSLRAGTCGGADCNPEILRQCAEQFPQPGLVQVYGQTEASTLISCPSYDDPERFETAGLPLPGYEVRITHPETRVVLPVGQIGQIEARGPMVMRGYFDKPEETAATIDNDGWLQSGDLGMLSESGRIVMAGGRLRDMIIRGGENIYPVEIENVLIKHDAVDEVAVFAAKDEYYGEIPVAAVRLNAPATTASLSEFCRSRIAGFKVPASYYVVKHFPLTSSGKVRKRDLQALHASGELEPLP